eukprot:gene4531-6396_t
MKSSDELPTHITRPTASYLGHTGRIFDLRYNKTCKFIVSSSEDSSVKVWHELFDGNIECVATLMHDKECEILRASFIPNASSSITDENIYSEIKTICTCSSDGNAFIWNLQLTEDVVERKNLKTRIKYVKSDIILKHNENAQIYVCEINLNRNEIITAADDVLYIWNLLNLTSNPFIQRFESYGSSFGGQRNPENIPYIFDAKICPQYDYIIAIALSDTTIRLVDMRNQDNMEMNVPNNAYPTRVIPLIGLIDEINDEVKGHITAISWHSSAESILVGLGSGNICLLDLKMGLVTMVLKGHESSVYGVSFISEDKNNDSSTSATKQCISFGNDCTTRLWSIQEDETFQTSERVLKVQNYPIFCGSYNHMNGSFLCGGGIGNRKGEFSFLGTPIHKLKIN